MVLPKVEQLSASAIRTLICPICELDLSVRSDNALRSHGITRVGDLVQYDLRGLSRIQNIGRKSWNEILDALEHRGLTLGMTLYQWNLISAYVEQRAANAEGVDAEYIDTLVLKKILSGRHVPDTMEEIVVYERIPKPDGEADRFITSGGSDDVEWLSDHAISMLVQPVGALDLSRRTERALTRHGIHRIGELIQYQIQELSKLAGIGNEAIGNIAAKVESHELRLGVSLPKWERVDHFIAQNAQVQGKGIIKHVDSASVRATLMGTHEPEHVEEMFSSNAKSELNTGSHEEWGRSVNEELDYLVKFAQTDRNKSMVRQFFGWDGSERKTLEDTGQLFGVTRERVRQVTTRAEKRIKRSACRCYRIEKMIKIVEESTPITRSGTYSLMNEADPNSSKASITGLLSAASVLNIETTLIVAPFYGAYIMASASELSWLKAIRSEAIRLNSARGVVNAEQLADFAEAAFVEHSTKVEVSQPVDSVTRVRSRRAVQIVLIETTEFDSIEPNDKWYVRRNAPRNRLINLIEKSMAASPGKIDLSEIRHAVSRAHRLEGFRPPISVVRGLCDRMAGVKRSGDKVEALSLDRSEILSPLEMKLYSMLVGRGGFGSIVDMEREAYESGLNLSSFYAYLTYSPILTKVSISIVALVGWEVPAGAVADLPVQRNVERGWKWSKDGRLCLWNELSVMTAWNGALTLPSQVAEYFQGELMLKDQEGRNIGEVVGTESFLYGFGKYFSRLGVEPGDVLVLKRSKSEDSLEMSIGDEVTIDAIDKEVDDLEYSVREYQ